MAYKKPLKLVEIVKAEDFTRQLYRAAIISHEIQGEGHFLVYLTEDNQVKVNEAIAGIKELNPFNRNIPKDELTEGHYDWISPEDSNPNYQHEPNKGGYIEPYSSTLIRVHFHPPKASAIPSPGDLGTLNNSRRQNENIAKLCVGDEKVIEYVNTIEIVGHIRDNNPDCYELFVCQEKPDKPIDFNDFMRRVAKRLNKKSGENILPEVYAMFGFRQHFEDVDECIRFFNDIGLHTTELFNVTGQDYSVFDGIEIFQSKFIIEEYF
jgi:hypothetical protein